MMGKSSERYGAIALMLIDYCRNGVVTWWYGNVTRQPYGYYERTSDFNVIPEVGGSAAA